MAIEQLSLKYMNSVLNIASHLTATIRNSVYVFSNKKTYKGSVQLLTQSGS